MHRSSPRFLVLAALVLAGCASPEASRALKSPASSATTRPGRLPASRPEANPSRTFRFRYTAKIPAPAGTKTLAIWVPLASDEPGVQQISDLKIQAPAGYRVTRDPDFGNRMIYCNIEDPPALTQIAWTARVVRFQDHGQGVAPVNPRFLSPNRLIPLDGKAKQRAEQLGVLDTTTPIHTRAKRIYDDVLTNMAYDKTQAGWGNGDFEYAMTVCKGNCTDFHSRFIGVGRAAGIPVRFTMGIPLKAKPQGSVNGYHCWAHYYDGAHWDPVDISEADKVAATDPQKAQWFFRNLDENRISISHGRDIVLNPPAHGGPRNYFAFPYAEADNKPVPLNKNEHWRFFYEDL